MELELESWRHELELELELERRVGVGEWWDYELELESGVYFFINVVSIRLISAAKASASSIDSRYPISFAISS